MVRSDGPAPPFDTPFAESDSAEERVFQALLQTRAPTGARALADRAECDAKTARKYLEWFARLGIATEHAGEPVTYERNEQYFEWRRASDLAASRTSQELAEAVQSIADRIDTYRDRYGAERPADVDALSPPEDVDPETAFADLTDWESLRAELRLHERARRLQRDGPGVAEV